MVEILPHLTSFDIISHFTHGQTFTRYHVAITVGDEVKHLAHLATLRLYANAPAGVLNDFQVSSFPSFSTTVIKYTVPAFAATKLNYQCEVCNSPLAQLPNIPDSVAKDIWPLTVSGTPCLFEYQPPSAGYKIKQSLCSCSSVTTKKTSGTPWLTVR